ncbi:MAG: hypothetical protein QXD82_04300 [Nitrososphaerales archaeon]
MNSEEVLAQNPDVIFFNEGHPGVSNVDDLLSFFPARSETEAIKEGRVFALPDFVINPGPRTAETIELIAETIHQIEI